MLHCKIFLLLLAICFGVAKLGRINWREIGVIKRIELCACAVRESVKFCEESCWNGDTLCNGVARCCNVLRKVNPSSGYYVQRYVKQKKLAIYHCHTLRLARQIAEKCPITLRFLFKSMTGLKSCVKFQIKPMANALIYKNS